MNHYEGYFAGHDNLPLFEQAWLPVGPPQATIVHVHGLIEHSGRHAEMAQAMTGEGYAVHAMDLRGHGRSEGPRCDVRSFDDYLLDLDVFFRRVMDRRVDGPVFLMGNSMGGLIATLWAIRRKPNLAGLILSGPLLALSDEIAPRLRHLAPVVSCLWPTLRVVRVPIHLLSRNPQAVETYRNDPHFFSRPITSRAGAEVLAALGHLPREAPSLDLPLLILHGGADRVCSAAGSSMLYEKAASKDKTLRIYEGLYHEVFDEPERAEVLADLAVWLARRAHIATMQDCPVTPQLPELTS
jgi:alpha-beta hydrolase superfamily lysophospholipase